MRDKGGGIRPRGVSDIKIETLPWPEWDRSLGLDEDGASARKERKDRQSRSRRNQAVTKRTPFGALTASVSARVTSKSRVGVRAREVNVGSLAD